MVPYNIRIWLRVCELVGAGLLDLAGEGGILTVLVLCRGGKAENLMDSKNSKSLSTIPFFLSALVYLFEARTSLNNKA